MADAILKGCVNEVRKYVETLGFQITNSQGYELVARARGLHSANVLAAQTSSKTVTQDMSGPSASTTEPLDKGNLTHDELSELHIVHLGDTCLPRRMVQDSKYQLDLIMPVRKGDDVDAQSVSQKLLGTPDGLSHFSAERVPYTYGKNYDAYRVRAQCYRFDGVQVAKAHPVKHYPDLSSVLRTHPHTLVAFGFNALDWQVGIVEKFRSNPFQGWSSETPLLWLQSSSSTRSVILQGSEFDTLKYLGGPYFEVTEGEYEGLIMAFYVDKGFKD